MNVEKLLIRFSKSDQGAVTLDWVVLAAAIIAMVITLAIVVSGGATTLAGEVSTNLSDQETGVK